MKNTHPDHLNTPRLIANQAQQAVWRNDNTEPFADSVPDENPSGLGAFEFPLRFAGQYADKETGRLQNWHRDLDPTSGRYVESDLVGLAGGINTYLYERANPLSLIDPDGLRALIQCLRCRGGGGLLSCSVDEDGVPGPSFNTNAGTNDQSTTPGDPYGTNGPLPPDSYDVLNAHSPGFGRTLPSPTNTGRPGEVVTPAGTVRSGIRIHQGTISQGCLTTGRGRSGADLERYIRELVNRNRNTGGTSPIIEERDCACTTTPPTCR